MRRTTCDGCLEDIEDGDAWFGMDEFVATDGDEADDDTSPEDDYEYAYHFHAHEDARCVWAWTAARQLDTST